MTIRNWQAVGGNAQISCDVVIVGTGPGGAAIGRILADAGKDVVFVEEGYHAVGQAVNDEVTAL